MVTAAVGSASESSYFAPGRRGYTRSGFIAESGGIAKVVLVVLPALGRAGVVAGSLFRRAGARSRKARTATGAARMRRATTQSVGVLRRQCQETNARSLPLPGFDPLPSHHS